MHADQRLVLGLQEQQQERLFRCTMSNQRLGTHRKRWCHNPSCG
jgi:hypothetical protein